MDLRERPPGAFVRHPWETARSHFFGGLVARSADGAFPQRILDVGAGDAWFAAQLAARCSPDVRIVCWDRAYTPEVLAWLAPQTPQCVSLCASRPDAQFDLVLLLDVLEHVEDDRAFLNSFVRENLTPDGRVLVSVPAWPCLYGRRDRHLGHHRRYTRRAYRDLLQASGLRILRSGGLFYSLLVPRLALALLEHLRRGPEARARHEWRYGAASARWLHRLLVVDAALARAAAGLRLDCPGLSCWALCERSR